MGTKAVGYCRVSTGEQADQGISLEMQATKIRQYCALNDVVLVKIIEDRGLSAKDIKGRPGFQRALDMVFSGKVDALVVYKLDRAFRSTRDALDVAEALNRKGWGLHSITEKLDTTSAIGEFFFTLMASLAQMERRLVSERTTAALSQKRANGGRVSRHAPYGFAFDSNGNLRMDDNEQATIAKVRALKSAGYSIRGIVGYLDAHGYRNRCGKSFGVGEIWKIARAA